MKRAMARGNLSRLHSVPWTRNCPWSGTLDAQSGRQLSTTRCLSKRRDPSQTKGKRQELNPYSEEKIQARRRQTEDSVRLSELAQAKARRTKYKVPYFDSFESIDPVLDYPTVPHSKEDRKYSTDRLEPQPEWSKFRFRAPVPEAEQAEISSTADASVGLTVEDLRSLRIKTLITHPVTNQTGKGKIRSMYSLAIAGDGKGLVGIGEGKDADIAVSSKKAETAAVKNMTKIELYENRTIVGSLTHKFHAVKMQIRSRPPGFGLRCNHYVFEISKALGIKDLSTKIIGSSNGMNTIKCFLEALQTIKPPAQISKERGRKIVDIEKVYDRGAESFR